LELRLEGLAGDFEKVLEMNEHRIRDKALSIMGGYTYEDAQLDGFQERVRIDLKKSFSMVLRKYRDGESDLIRQIYFTQFVVQ
jgi:flagellar basal body-associated protein FliL